MNRKKWFGAAVLVLSLAAAGLAYGPLFAGTGESGYVCPLTGDELPCTHCCPLNGR